jgi:transposase
VYFKSSIRLNPVTGKIDSYYRLIESYRNIDDRVCHRTLLNVGFLPNIALEQLNKIQSHLNSRYKKQETLFEETDAVVIEMTDELWHQLVNGKRIDVDWVDKAKRQIDADSIKHSNVREIGTEWMCQHAWNQLQLSEFLRAQGWQEEKIKLAMTQVISRAAYPASENRTSHWINDNSAVCEVTGYDAQQSGRITKDKLYRSALDLYGIKSSLEKHLSDRTNTLFDLQDKIYLYDLTNTYFEGRKSKSTIAKHGRSKEKPSYAKLVVLAMVVNMEGFIKYTSIHEGNIADCKTLSSLVEKLNAQTHHRQGVVVLDAGIATEENLKLLQEKGYHYVCVSRTNLKEFTIDQSRMTVMMETKSKQDIVINAIKTNVNTDYYLQIKSQAKGMKKGAMKNLFEIRFEEALQKIKNSLDKKGGVKKADKVHELIGRAKEKFPSVHHYYHINVVCNKDTEQVRDIIWHKNESTDAKKIEGHGVYFVRTNLLIKDEMVVWNIYNTIREIESTFRTLKNDLDLRPIYHKNDDSTMAHLHLGILSYWLVNTRRHQFKMHEIKSSWKEIVRIGNTQKIITTSGQNTFDEIISVRKCSDPNQQLKQLLDILKAKHRPFKKIKSVVHKPTQEKKKTQDLLISSG